MDRGMYLCKTYAGLLMAYGKDFGDFYRRSIHDALLEHFGINREAFELALHEVEGTVGPLHKMYEVEIAKSQTRDYIAEQMFYELSTMKKATEQNDG